MLEEIKQLIKKEITDWQTLDSVLPEVFTKGAIASAQNILNFIETLEEKNATKIKII